MTKYPNWFDLYLVNFKSTGRFPSMFSRLVKKPELYLNCTNGNCSSGFLRRLQKIDKISQLIWPLLSKFQIKMEISSICFGLLRKPELYLNSTNANCSSGFLRRPQKIDKVSHLIWPLLRKFQINWKILSIFFGLLKKLEVLPE